MRWTELNRLPEGDTPRAPLAPRGGETDATGPTFVAFRIKGFDRENAATLSLVLPNQACERPAWADIEREGRARSLGRLPEK